MFVKRSDDVEIVDIIKDKSEEEEKNDRKAMNNVLVEAATKTIIEESSLKEDKKINDL